MNPDLSVNLGGLKLKNPVIAASGTFGFGREYDAYYNIACLGAITIKGITLEPREGNPPPRVIETPAGMLNCIGLQNPGVEAFLRDEMPWLIAKNVPVIANINGATVKEYGILASMLDGKSGVAGLEINVSCPNVKAGGMNFGVVPEMVRAVMAEVRKYARIPVIVKLSPNVTDIVTIAKAAADAGADCLSLINTVSGLAIDVGQRKPFLSNIFGGLSGPAIKPIALRMVWQVYEAVKLPIIGMGGIMETEDALEFIMAGAGAVSLGTANFVNPRACPDIIAGIERYCREKSVQDLQDLVGAAHR
ncbi:MAG: dihydroorotate dehydrogenase [Bacillota bacterium]